MDLDTVPKIDEVFKTARDYNERLKGYLLLSMYPTNIFIDEAHQAADILEYPNLFLLQSRIFERKIYRDTWADSLFVH